MVEYASQHSQGDYSLASVNETLLEAALQDERQYYTRYGAYLDPLPVSIHQESHQESHRRLDPRIKLFRSLERILNRDARRKYKERVIPPWGKSGEMLTNRYKRTAWARDNDYPTTREGRRIWRINKGKS